MSNSRMLGCLDCKETIWIGLEGTPIFYKEADCMDALSKFLVKHIDHTLHYYTLFLSSPDYKSIEW